jgi:hypothetical protein
MRSSLRKLVFKFKSKLTLEYSFEMQKEKEDAFGIRDPLLPPGSKNSGELSAL